MSERPGERWPERPAAEQQERGAMSVRHVVLIRLAAGTTPEQLAAIEEGLASLPPAIPEIRAYTFGPNVGPNRANADYAVVADFDSLDDFAAYRDHPAHVKVRDELIEPVSAERVAVQFELPAGAAG